MQAGMGVMSGGTLGGAVGTFVAGSISTAGVVTTAAAAGAMGSIASQVVGNAIGAQDGFSWKGVVLSALGSGVTSGLGASGLLPTTDSVFANAALRQAVSSTISQGVSVVTGLQQRFDWKSVAAGAVGAGVGASVGQALQSADAFSSLGGGFGTDLARGAVSGFAGGMVTAVMRGGRVSVQQVATDAFGNALGSSLAYSSSLSGEERLSQAASTTGDFARMDGASYRSAPYETPWSGGEDWMADAATRAAANPLYVSNMDNGAAFRASERAHRSATEESVQGSSYRASAGDTISGIVGSSRPQDVGNFIRANGLTSDGIVPGQNYFVPDSSYAYGDQTASGQTALNMGNARVAAARMAEAAQAVTTTNTGVTNEQAGAIYMAYGGRSASYASTYSARPSGYVTTSGEENIQIDGVQRLKDQVASTTLILAQPVVTTLAKFASGLGVDINPDAVGNNMFSAAQDLIGASRLGLNTQRVRYGDAMAMEVSPIGVQNYDPTNITFHQYKYTTTIGKMGEEFADISQIAPIIDYASAPKFGLGEFQAMENGRQKLAFDNYILHSSNYEAGQFANQTYSDHVFHAGSVESSIYWDGKNLKLETVGYGYQLQ